ncbi:MAG TPA: acetyl-CoA carboxylase biotin carboxyl carrier protein [Phycisphaerales bacterium]|nr:acetyl-CoA carboxylase biotin carboxyl carrier protein [Phycisphaerales bacterium]HMP37487.1 acetyl-CoA carboxylase biotin carboxyl carrier protein [Phycisphaerales bacterium]
MLDIRKLKELVRLMVVNDLTEIDLRDSQEQVTLKRTGPAAIPTVTHLPVAGHAGVPVTATLAVHPGSGGGGGSGAGVGAGAAADRSAADAGDDDELVAIESPMVGTFYASPAPDKPTFVKVGGSIGAETVVCLIEAMKVFNEIKAECEGTIEKVLVRSGEPVEFGQKLFLVRPA